jgi:hypothetical protein
MSRGGIDGDNRLMTDAGNTPADEVLDDATPGRASYAAERWPIT